MKKIIKRYTNLNRLSYLMVIAFGISFLLEICYWQFGRTTITTPIAIIKLNYGLIGEPHLWIRIVEGIISFGLIILGVSRVTINKNNNNNKGKSL